MLNKIENISLKPEMRNEIKSSKTDSGLNKVHRRDGFADTLTYSSALIFISSLNWKLKRFNIKSENILEIEIQYDDYGFMFVVNQKNPAIKGVYVRISDYKILSSTQISRVACEINFDLRDVSSDEINYDVLNTFFSRIRTFLIPGENEVKSTYHQNILIGLDERLTYLLSQVYNKVLQFVEKLNNKKVFLPTDDSLSNAQNIIIKGIQVVYE
jgi:hypothetical protein